MECPVCYECEARCTFVCGHSFCYRCVKTWYQKGSATCPMCRNAMCFRGVVEAKRSWEREKKDAVLAEVLEELMEDIEEEGDFEYAVDMLGIVHERYNKIMEDYPDTDDETLSYILRAPWVNIVDPECIWPPQDVPTHERNLMVSKTAYGFKRPLGGLFLY